MGIRDIISAGLILIGVVFMLLAAIGLIRFPDFYIRNSASTKAAILGLGLILLGTGIYYNQILIFVELSAIFLFIFLINPLASHIVARAAFKTKVPFWKKTNLDDIKELEKKEKDKKKAD
ncbi:monovalent cation/H(+) antiporter subunit G [Echinicola jeungdonensis]|uniref:Monovalent cation/H(+) antiporter subunit G n=1 Tax=Echinicola jeungdonensis TaxID=709343 RepID=A0ABV5J0I1_9BACT|nr:monovalent cation/H(+) antiporter subunit G [Echinicola jeungdonensis]MDN3671063.1 monovalent cation/H(+) antiporter subunit G [Echinicola jeungdonensis]